jgi:hypothetical protein
MKQKLNQKEIEAIKSLVKDFNEAKNVFGSAFDQIIERWKPIINKCMLEHNLQIVSAMMTIQEQILNDDKTPLKKLPLLGLKAATVQMISEHEQNLMAKNKESKIIKLNKGTTMYKVIIIQANFRLKNLETNASVPFTDLQFLIDEVNKKKLTLINADELPAHFRTQLWNWEDIK